MAKKEQINVIKFRGIPVTGDINSFLKLLETNCGYEHSDLEESRVEISGTFVGMDTSSDILFSIKSKTVYDIGVELMESDGADYKYYKSLYTKKYGASKKTKRNGDEVDSFTIEGGRIDLIDQGWGIEIRYVNTINEKLAKKEHEQALLDEI